MVTIGGLLASAVVKMAGDKLGSAIAEQASLAWNVREHMEDMKNTLETIEAVLKDAERRSIREDLVRLWLKRLKNAAYDISHMLDEFQDMSTQQQMTGIIPIAITKISHGNKMKKMREKLRKIEAEHTSFNFMQNTITICDQQSYDSRETASEDVIESEIIGRDADKLTLVGLLSSCCDTEAEQVTILPIYGLGGIGKSTLAGLVYRDTQFKEYHRVWVYVSQMFDPIKIGNSIISQLSTERKKETNSRELISQCLDDLLSDKKVLVVLDDLWEDKESELNKLKTMLRSRKGSTIYVIVTTRREEIASKVCTDNCKPYELKPLEKDTCWGIIKRYSQFENKASKERLQPIGLSIAEKCGGVALAAQALGRTLKKIEDIDGWSEIDNNDIWMNENPLGTEVLPSLQLSYDRMLPTLRLCFSYCAIFPKGHDIVEADLIHQWAAMDFVQQPFKGKEYIKELLGMSFLQHSKLPSVSAKHVVYTMHDLVHDLARSVISDELIVSGAPKKRNTSEQKYCWCASLQNYDGEIKLSKILPKRVRALQFSNSFKLDTTCASFSFAKWLRVLDFSDCSDLLLPVSIGQLKQLRCLIAPRLQNTVLPRYITALPKLQYINMHGSFQLSALPERIGELSLLRYLRLSGCSGITKLPESLGDLKCMVHLDMSGCSGLIELPHSVDNLTQLHCLELSGCSSLKALPESLCVLTQLQYLTLSSCSCLEMLPVGIGSLVGIRHLYMSDCIEIRELPESFGDLKCMVHLDMSGCRGLTELPHSIGNLTQLQHLELSGCSSLKALPETLCCLTQLQRLYLSDCKGIRQLPELRTGLQSLSHLNLSGCWGMPGWSLTGLRGLTALQDLDISRHGYSGLSEYLRSLPNNLKYLKLSSCYLEYCDFIARLSNLELLDLSYNGLKYLPESIGNLKRLHTLDLSYCKSLEFLPECIGALGLKSLLLEGCSDALLEHASSLLNYIQTLPVFKVRADEVNGCSNLHLLEGINVSELRIFSLENVRSLEEASKVKLLEKHNLSVLRLSWSTKRGVEFVDDQDLLGQLVPPRGLKSMRMDGYNCTSFPVWLMCIHSHLPNLVSIQLHDMPTCSNLPPLGQLQHLERLSLWKLPAIKRIDREFCGGRGAFCRLSYFSITDMKGLVEWNTTYSVEDGVERLMFPVLNKLEIRDCPSLRLKPCPPTFRDGSICGCDQVIASLEEAVNRMSQISLPPSNAMKLDVSMEYGTSQSIRIFHHFPALQELSIHHYELKSLPESMQHLTSLVSLTLVECNGISSLPEWLGDLSSLKSLVFSVCMATADSSHLCIHERVLSYFCDRKQEIRKWCESEEKKKKLAHINIRFINAEWSEDIHW